MTEGAPVSPWPAACQHQAKLRQLIPATAPILTPPLLYPCPGEREKLPAPPCLPAVTTPWGGEIFFAPFPPFPPAASGRGSSRAGPPQGGGAQPLHRAGSLPEARRGRAKASREPCKAPGRQKSSPVPAASGLCASAGSAVMATTIKYDGSWSRVAVLFVSHHSGFGPWLIPSLGTLRGAGAWFGPRTLSAIPGGQRSLYDDQKGPLEVISPGPHPKQGLPLHTNPQFLHATPTLSCSSGGQRGTLAHSRAS